MSHGEIRQDVKTQNITFTQMCRCRRLVRCCCASHLRLRATPDPALYPSQIPFQAASCSSLNAPVVQRLWGGRDLNSSLTLDEFADALSGRAHENPCISTARTRARDAGALPCQPCLTYLLRDWDFFALQ